MIDYRYSDEPPTVPGWYFFSIGEKFQEIIRAWGSIGALYIESSIFPKPTRLNIFMMHCSGARFSGPIQFPEVNDET